MKKKNQEFKKLKLEKTIIGNLTSVEMSTVVGAGGTRQTLSSRQQGCTTRIDIEIEDPAVDGNDYFDGLIK